MRTAMRLFALAALALLPAASSLRLAGSGAARTACWRAPPRLAAAKMVTEGGSSATPARSVIALLAVAGAAETGMLVADKLWGASALASFCAPGAGCADVLNGPWASVAGVPLALFGFVAYAAMALLAAAPLIGGGGDGDGGGSGSGAGALAVGAGGMAAFSACLMLELATVIGRPCVLCIASAVLSASMAAAVWGSASLLPDKTERAVLTGSGAAAGLLAAAALYYIQTDGGTTVPLADGLKSPPPIASRSSPRALALTRRLAKHDARFYGAWWCSHCADQKEALGADAFASIEYFECAPDGVNSRRPICAEAGVEGYPTWQLDGKLFAGERSLPELEEMLDEIEAEGGTAAGAEQ